MNYKDLLKNRGSFTKKEVFEHKQEIIDAYRVHKCMKEGASIGFKHFKPQEVTKMHNFGTLNDDQLGVEVIANMAMFMDSDNDVLLESSWTQTVSQKGNMIKFQHDHRYSVEATIGDTKGWENRTIDLAPYGYSGKQGVGLVHIAIVEKDYNKGVFAKYKNGNINQHSIGMSYRKIELASDEEGREDEYKLWVKFKDLLINSEKAEEKGYFWIIREIELYENSAVLFGANSLTPTLSVQTSGSDSSKDKKIKSSASETKSKFFTKMVRSTTN